MIELPKERRKSDGHSKVVCEDLGRMIVSTMDIAKTYK